jgi:hypothetical protein
MPPTAHCQVHATHSHHWFPLGETRAVNALSLMYGRMTATTLMIPMCAMHVHPHVSVCENTPGKRAFAHSHVQTHTHGLTKVAEDLQACQAGSEEGHGDRRRNWHPQCCEPRSRLRPLVHATSTWPEVYGELHGQDCTQSHMCLGQARNLTLKSTTERARVTTKECTTLSSSQQGN